MAAEESPQSKPKRKKDEKEKDQEKIAIKKQKQIAKEETENEPPPLVADAQESDHSDEDEQSLKQVVEFCKKANDPPQMPKMTAEQAHFLNFWLCMVSQNIQHYYNYGAGKRKKNNKNHVRMDSDVFWDRLRECFEESAPNLFPTF
jgi:hypothetical protein